MTSARRELILSMAFFCFLEEALISQSSEGEEEEKGRTTSNQRERVEEIEDWDEGGTGTGGGESAETIALQCGG